MAAMFTYTQAPAFDPARGVLARRAAFRVYAAADTTRATPLPVYANREGTVLLDLASDALGLLPAFWCTAAQIVAVSGPYTTPASSVEYLGGVGVPLGGAPGQVLTREAGNGLAWADRAAGLWARFRTTNLVTNPGPAAGQVAGYRVPSYATLAPAVVEGTPALAVTRAPGSGSGEVYMDPDENYPVVAGDVVRFSADVAAAEGEVWTETRRNHSIRPRPTDSTFGSWNPGTGEAGTTVYGLTGSGLPQSDSYAMRTITTAKTGGNDGWKAWSVGDGTPVAGRAGQTWTLSLYIRYSGADLPVVLRIYAYAGTSTVTSSDSSPTILRAGAWARISVTVTATGDFDRIGWAAFHSPEDVPQSGTTISVAALQVEQAAGPTPYLDGDTPDTADRRYSWTGAVNGSASVEETRTIVPAPTSANLWLGTYSGAATTEATNAPAVGIGAGFQRLSGTWTVTAPGTVRAFTRTTDTIGEGAGLYVRRYMVTINSDAGGGYLDGDTPATRDRVYGWDGPPGASTSAEYLPITTSS